MLDVLVGLENLSDLLVLSLKCRLISMVSIDLLLGLLVHFVEGPLFHLELLDLAQCMMKLSTLHQNEGPQSVKVHNFVFLLADPILGCHDGRIAEMRVLGPKRPLLVEVVIASVKCMEVVPIKLKLLKTLFLGDQIVLEPIILPP